MRRSLALVSAMCFSLSHAQALSDSDRSAFRNIIASQIEAIRANDGAIHTMEQQTDGGWRISG